MVLKVTGYRLFTSKKGTNACVVSCVRQARKGSGEVGLIAETHFLPPYLVERVDDYVDKICNFTFHKWNDTYTVSNVTVIDTVGLDNII